MTTPDPRRYADLDWNAGNREKIARRGISEQDCEDVLRSGDAEVRRNKRSGSASYTVVGPTRSGRRLQVNVAWDDERTRRLRVVGAWWI